MNGDLSTSDYEKLCHTLHEQACALNQELYKDPKTGLWVMTRVHLLRKAKCCESGCRHCPYGFKKP